MPLHDVLRCVQLWRDFPERLARHSGMNVFDHDRLGNGHARNSGTTGSIDCHDIEVRVELPGVLQSTGAARTSIVGGSQIVTPSRCVALLPARIGQISQLSIARILLWTRQPHRDWITPGATRRLPAKKMQKPERQKMAQILYWRWSEIWLDEKFVAIVDVAPKLRGIPGASFIFRGELDGHEDQGHPVRIGRAAVRNDNRADGSFPPCWAAGADSGANSGFFAPRQVRYPCR